jgi:hypothetical protein
MRVPWEHGIFTACVRGIPVSKLYPLMQDRIVHGPTTKTLRTGWLLACAALAGCSSISGDSPMTVFADPGKYQYFTCEQLAAQRKSWQLREQELRQLMDKAEQSTGGAVVSVLAYKADYVSATEELKVVESAARAKNCDTPDKWNSNSSVK